MTENNPAAEGWIILRTTNGRTLRLAASLAEDGFETWTPEVIRNVRIPRANFRRDVAFPLLPGLVFVRSRHLVDLLELAAMAVKPRRGAGLLKPAHDGFSVFRHADRIPVIADADLEPLREEVCNRAARAARRRRKHFDPHDQVRVTSGAFEGMRGTVVCSNGRSATVCFGANIRVKISTFILQPNNANSVAKT